MIKPTPNEDNNVNGNPTQNDKDKTVNWIFAEQSEDKVPENNQPDESDDFEEVEDSPPFIDRFKISKEEFNTLTEFRKNNETRNRIAIYLIGVFFTPVTLAGALIGFVRSFNRLERHKGGYPFLHPLKPITRLAMAIGAGIAWLCMAVVFVYLLFTVYNGSSHQWLTGYLVANTVISSLVFGIFVLWQRGIANTLLERDRFGSARFARPDELPTLKNKTGFYIGQGHAFDDKGHILTVAGTRGGKGTNLIIPNLLGVGSIETSWVVIDPKGENAAISARYQRESGQNVVILNPWDLLAENIGQSQSYNPLDIFSDKSSPHLVDDVQMLAEMIVPIDKSASDPFWSDTARMIVAGLLLHLVTSQPEQDRTLKTLWNWVRLDSDAWDVLIQDMGTNDDPVNGDIVQNAANEILKLANTGGDTFGSIMSGVLLATDFLKSPALQKSLKTGFDPKTLIDGKTTVYVIIPADKLRSHSRWLRMVVTSMMRCVIRQSGKRVTFLLDEFAALGYLPEIETALSTYAGYNVTVWPILQSLVQLQDLYKNNWESFIANCTVRQYFTLNDNTSATYVSEAIGHTSNVTVNKAWFGVRDAQSSQRLLITPDELRRESGKKIFMFVNDLPPTYVDKFPYYKMPIIQDRAGKNPYL